MPVFNGEKYVSEAIESALAQNFTNFELIISDNASHDSTAQIAKDFAKRDSRVRYVRNGENIGACRNLNRGVELARGEYIKWLNHDDLVCENFLSSCMEALDAEPRAVLAYGRTEIIDEEGRLTHRDPGGLPDMDHDDRFKRFRDALIFGGTMHEMHGVFRLDALKHSQLLRPYFGSDRALLSEMALLGRFVRVSNATLYNRDHSQRSFMSKEKDIRSEFAGGSSRSLFALEQLPLVHNLLEIAWSHRDICPRSKTVPFILAWAVKPINLFRIASELVWLVLPTFHQKIRSAAWGLLSNINFYFPPARNRQ